MVMGSSSMENSANDCADKPCLEEVKNGKLSNRPKFFPCSVCNHFFTPRALLVHKRTCLENENCKCIVCRSKPKEIKFKRRQKKKKKTLSYSSSYFHQKRRKIKPRLREALTAKNRKIKNGAVCDNTQFTHTEKDDRIDETIEENNSECPESSDNDSNNVHKYISDSPDSSQMNMPETPINSPEKSWDMTELKERYDHDCNRKLFCCFCNEHVYWETFGVHVIKHCKKQNECLKCPYFNCDRFFSQPTLFLTHYPAHNSDHPLECNECFCSDPVCSTANRVVLEHGYAESDPFHCYICLTHFNHPQTVINHMRLHSKEMPYKCTVCNRSFRQLGNLQRHKTTHRGDRPHRCSICPSSFADPATLRNHERVHTGETPYVCKICNRGFTQVGNLKRHMALHLKKDPSSKTLSATIEVISDENTLTMINPPKDLIPTDASQNNALSDYFHKYVHSSNGLKTSKRKIRRKNGKMKVFTCTICNKVYAWKHDLTVHFRTHTGEKPYKCELCGKQFAQSGAVRIHQARHHAGAANNHSKQRN